MISQKAVVHALGKGMVAALPSFHAFCAADQTGQFTGKAKLTRRQALNRCPVKGVFAFSALGNRGKLSPDTERCIETFAFQLYELGNILIDVISGECYSPRDS